MKRHFNVLSVFIFFISVAVFNCSPSKTEIFKAGVIPDNTYDPEKWGNIFPFHYESWKQTENPKPAGKSRYKKGWDTDRIVYDKLSEFPFAALLYNGWGFGIEYNEPRGHKFAITDQIEIDKSRTAPGGVCLACKSPYHKLYVKKHGIKYLKADLNSALEMFPSKTRKLGPACIDCHNNNTMETVTNKLHIEKGLKMLKKNKLTRQEKRTLSCAQCHITYYVPRDKNGKVAGDVLPPWSESKWGNISIEKIIADLLKDYQRLEWKQKVTGFRMPYIRHPEFELFSNNSVHWNAGLSCPDCHMPYKRKGTYKISDHNVQSPLKDGMRSCSQCHTESSDWIKKQVFAIQDRNMSLILRAGYQTAVAAKLFEKIHLGSTIKKSSNNTLYRKAKDFYIKAFLRINFANAENSTGFHNPTETARILGDAIAYSGKSEALLRQFAAEKKINLNRFTKLELKRYLSKRGTKNLNFKPEQEFKDPYNNQKDFLTNENKGI